jgi:hypothetical protein
MQKKILTISLIILGVLFFLACEKTTELHITNDYSEDIIEVTADSNDNLIDSNISAFGGTRTVSFSSDESVEAVSLLFADYSWANFTVTPGNDYDVYVSSSGNVTVN